MSDLTIGFHVMIALNLIQFFFWAKMVQRLVDKVMSRNYYEYQVSESIPEKKPLKVDIPGMPEDMATLNEIAY